MQKFLLAAALFAGSASLASAQTTAVKANIFSPLVKTGSFFVEHRVGEHSSVQLGALLTRWGTGDTQLNGFALTPEYRRYLSDGQGALRGFYVAPFLRYQNLTLSNDYTGTDAGGRPTQERAEAALRTYGGGLLAGYQWILGRHFSLDAFLGPSYNNGTIKVKESGSGYHDNFDAGVFSGFGLRTGVTFGVAF